jgi:superfamily II DNA or RNA helicase
MTEIFVDKLNESTLRVTSNDFGVEQELNEFFTFDVPGARFMPSYKARLWDGKARSYNLHTKTIPYGLLEYVRKFAESNDYKVTESLDSPGEDVTIEEVQEFVNSLNLHTGGQKIALRDYQVNAVFQAISRGRIIAKSPTSSGKSAIIYCYIRWKLQRNERIILMVPTTGLVTQMFSDFEDYSSHNGWSTEDNVHKLYGGQDRNFDKPVLVTTWQSVHSMSKKKDPETRKFYESWTVYIGDECHRFASNSLMQISTKLTNAKYRLGTTGTVQDEKVQKLSLEGSFGPIFNVISTKELMDAGQVVQLKIKCLILDYDAEVKKLLKSADYQQEVDFIVSNKRRIKFVVNLAKATKGNTLVLFNFIDKQGKPMYELAKELCPDRPLFYISGEVDTDTREQIRKVLSTHDDAIVFGSSATMSTGINVPSLENIIFASPSKSKIRNLQSIGRGLRLKEGKTSCTLYDIADNFAMKSKLNFAMKHFKERLEQYQLEQFEYNIKQLSF